jgi:arylamine N-acetyltransferase
VNIIILPDGSRYSCDVGFGGDGPTRPLPLISGNIIPNLGSQEIRLQHEVIPDYLTEPQKLWVYQYRNGAAKPWNSFYTFGENEWLPRDFDAINYWASTYPDTIQTNNMLIVRFLKRPESGIYGKVMLVNNEVKQNLGGKTSLLQTCKTENERIEVLKSVFDITLSDEERLGIKGRLTELPSFPH